MKLFVDDLTVMDFSYLCPTRGIVGESWIVDIVLDGGLNEESMVQDFGIVKKQLKRLIDDYIDHKLVIPADYSGVAVNRDYPDQRVAVEFEVSGQDSMYLVCPPEAYAFVYTDNIDKPSVIEYLKGIIKTHLPENVHGIDIHLREENIPTAAYHYTHGLKKHDGNCQRIAHGHRSKVVIKVDGQRSDELEHAIAKKWRDIYVGSQEDIVSDSEITELPTTVASQDNYSFKYESSQGIFELTIAKSRCDIIKYDSTVECIAQHLYESLKPEIAGALEVRAFEGVGKGAIVADYDDI